MKTKDLLTVWGAPEPPRLTPKQISIRLPMLVAAKISALGEMYPKKNKTDIIGDLLNAALEQMEHDFPKVKGECVGPDRNDEVLYEDVGVASTFRELTLKYLRKMEREAGVTEPLEYSTRVMFSEND